MRDNFRKLAWPLFVAFLAIFVATRWFAFVGPTRPVCVVAASGHVFLFDDDTSRILFEPEDAWGIQPQGPSLSLTLWPLVHWNNDNPFAKTPFAYVNLSGLLLVWLAVMVVFEVLLLRRRRLGCVCGYDVGELSRCPECGRRCADADDRTSLAERRCVSSLSELQSQD